MAAPENQLVDTAIDSVLAEIPSISFLKKEQREALCAFVDRKDVCAFLPTGFGKSLIYQLAPLVVEATRLGISAVKLGDNDDEIIHGRYQLVFGSPESWLLNPKWRDMLASLVYRQRLEGIVADEVHAAYKW